VIWQGLTSNGKKGAFMAAQKNWNEREFKKKLSEIKEKGKLCVSDTIVFKSIDQIIIDLLGLKKKDGTEYKRGFFQFGNCTFEFGNEGIWIPKLTKDKDWVNSLSSDWNKLTQIPLGAKQNEPSKDDTLVNIFAKFEDGYRFVGKFTSGELKGKSKVYSRVSEEVSLK
jgi:hypothetical protein